MGWGVPSAEVTPAMDAFFPDHSRWVTSELILEGPAKGGLREGGVSFFLRDRFRIFLWCEILLHCIVN